MTLFVYYYYYHFLFPDLVTHIFQFFFPPFIFLLFHIALRIEYIFSYYHSIYQGMKNKYFIRIETNILKELSDNIKYNTNIL